MSSTDKAGFESRLVPTFPSLYPHFNCLRAFDLVSSRVWWEAATSIGRSKPRADSGPNRPPASAGQPSVGELHFCPLCTALDQASSLSRKLAYVPGPTFGFVKPLASSGSHCTKWADEQHWQAGFESRLLPDLPLPFIPTLIGLRLLTLCQVVSGGRQRQILRRAPSFLAGPSGIRAGWVLETKSRLGAE